MQKSYLFPSFLAFDFPSHPVFQLGMWKVTSLSVSCNSSLWMYRAVTDSFVNLLMLPVSISHLSCNFQKMTKTSKSQSPDCQGGEFSSALSYIFYLWCIEATQVKFLQLLLARLSNEAKRKWTGTRKQGRLGCILLGVYLAIQVIFTCV